MYGKFSWGAKQILLESQLQHDGEAWGSAVGWTCPAWLVA
jgi:TPP-dependent 2-oxoacid decarboxylase